MGVRILDGGKDGAALYCSTTEWSFGPVFEHVEAAQAFLDWWEAKSFADPRTYSGTDLADKHREWFHQVYIDGNFFHPLADKAVAKAKAEVE